jgi:putative MFS transporter
VILDGYVLGTGGFALAWWGPQIDLSTWWTGAIGSATLFGLFAGSLIFGRITDRIGRKMLFFVHLLALLLLSLAQFVVNTPEQLFTVRFLMGVAIGADYAVSITLLSEYAPRKHRGALLSLLNVLALVGFLLAFLVAQPLEGVGGDDNWRWLLASSAVIAAAVLLLRIGAPESPRWLWQKGRHEEANAIVAKFYGPNVVIKDSDVHEETKAGFADLFRNGMWRRTLFAGGFWACQIMPFYALYIFLDQIMSLIGLENPFWASLFFTLFLVFGAVVGIPLINRYKRRPVLIWTFALSALALAALTLMPSSATIPVVVLFALLAVCLQAGSNLETVYPGELFPTELRATGIGVAAAISRIGACGGTFLLPTLLEEFGVDTALWFMTGVLVLGFFISKTWAPETKDLPLDEASRSTPDLRPARQRG